MRFKFKTISELEILEKAHHAIMDRVYREQDYLACYPYITNDTRLEQWMSQADEIHARILKLRNKQGRAQ
jgi:hypothetical protein